jgi:hypothetical protein
MKNKTFKTMMKASKNEAHWMRTGISSTTTQDKLPSTPSIHSLKNSKRAIMKFPKKNKNKTNNKIRDISISILQLK